MKFAHVRSCTNSALLRHTPTCRSKALCAAIAVCFLALPEADDTAGHDDSMSAFEEDCGSNSGLFLPGQGAAGDIAPASFERCVAGGPEAWLLEFHSHMC